MVSGKIIDQTTQQPVAGASISAAKKNIAVTDASGEFRVAVPKGSRLSISNVGFNDTTFVIGEQSILFHWLNNSF